MMKIKITLEYGCSPVWDISASHTSATNIAINSLPVSNDLINDLQLWNEKYQKAFINNSEEFRYVGFKTVEDEKKFNEMGIRIMHRLEDELPASWQLVKFGK